MNGPSFLHHVGVLRSFGYALLEPAEGAPSLEVLPRSA